MNMHLFRLKQLILILSIAFVFSLFALVVFFEREDLNQTLSSEPAENAAMHRIKKTEIMFHFTNISQQNSKGSSSYPDDESSNKIGYGSYLFTNHTRTRLKLQSLKYVKPLREDLGEVINDVESFKYTTMTLKSHFEPASCAGGVDLMILIISAPGNIERRKLVRQTWVSKLQPLTRSKSLSEDSPVNTFAYAFFVGGTNNQTLKAEILKESEAHGDILETNIVDEYRRLTLKSVAMIYWIKKFCSTAKFNLKVDDDVYVNMYYLLKVYKTAIAEEYHKIPSILGAQTPEHDPDRNPRSRHYLDKYTWPWSSFPSYVFGGCYMISNAAIRPLLAAAQTTPYFIFEDLYVTSLCARKVGVRVMTNERFFFMKGEVPTNIDRCFVQEGVTWELYLPKQMLSSHLVTRDVFVNLDSNQLPFDYEFCANLMNEYSND